MIAIADYGRFCRAQTTCKLLAYFTIPDTVFREVAEDTGIDSEIALREKVKLFIGEVIEEINRRIPVPE